MKPKQYPSQVELRALFDYKDGQLIRKSNSKPAGHFHCGYREIKLNKVNYKAHRLIWIYCNGDIFDTTLVIDHFNGDTLDNRIENLRLTTHRENHFNRHKEKGYYFSKRRNKWVSQIQAYSIKKWLGVFSTECGARLAYLNAKLGRTLYGRSYYSY
jgi:hypothetical protein